MIRFANTEDKEKIQKMWSLCFSDTEEFQSLYFSKIFQANQTLILEVRNTIVASLQIIPYDIRCNKKTLSAGYVFGAMTSPKYRNKGYMSKLLEAAFNEMKAMNMKLSLLIPQEEWLFGYYARLGYVKAFPRSTQPVCLSPKTTGMKAFLVPDSFDITYQYKTLLNRQPQVVLKNEEQIAHFIEDHYASGGCIVACPQGIALTLAEGDKIFIKELLAETEDAQQALLAAILDVYKQEWVSLSQYAKPDEASATYYGMVKILDRTIKFLPNTYMSMMLD